MEKQQFNITIDAPKEKVWKTLWDDTTYRKWTSAFMEGSYAKSDWKEGSRILFLSPKGEGMVAIIAAKKPNEFMSFKHIGMVKDGVEDLDSDDVKSWAGALENYTLKAVDGKTELIVESDTNDEYKEMFENIWPKALANVKELAETN